MHAPSERRTHQPRRFARRLERVTITFQARSRAGRSTETDPIDRRLWSHEDRLSPSSTLRASGAGAPSRRFAWHRRPHWLTGTDPRAGRRALRLDVWRWRGRRTAQSPDRFAGRVSAFRHAPVDIAVRPERKHHLRSAGGGGTIDLAGGCDVKLSRQCGRPEPGKRDCRCARARGARAPQTLVACASAAGRDPEDTARLIESGGVKPAASRNVGARSLKLMNASAVSPAFARPGHRIANGTRAPASYTFAFARGNGMPLSAVMTTSVLSSSPSARRRSRMSPSSRSKRCTSKK